MEQSQKSLIPALVTGITLHIITLGYLAWDIPGLHLGYGIHFYIAIFLVGFYSQIKFGYTLPSPREKGYFNGIPLKTFLGLLLIQGILNQTWNFFDTYAIALILIINSTVVGMGLVVYSAITSSIILGRLAFHIFHTSNLNTN